MKEKKEKKKSQQRIDKEYRKTHPSLMGLFEPKKSSLPVCKICGKKYFDHVTMADLENCAKQLPGNEKYKDYNYPLEGKGQDK